VRLTTSQRKTLLLWNLNRGGQGPIWSVAPLDGWMHVVGGDLDTKMFKTTASTIQKWRELNFCGACKTSTSQLFMLINLQTMYKFLLRPLLPKNKNKNLKV
jgi:hypothetical protein